MAGHSDKRHTRINFEALTARKSPAQTPTIRRSDTATAENAHGNLEFPTGNTKSISKRPQALNSRSSATGLKHLKLPATLKARVSKVVKFSSPWNVYDKVYDLRLGDGDLVVVGEVRDPWSYGITAAESRTPSPYLVTVRSFPVHNAEQKIPMLQRIEHKNIVSIREIFNYEGSFYCVFEHMPLSLSHFAGIPKPLTERQLASILGQVLA